MDDSLILDDSIAALASAPGPAARGIVRVSGGETRVALDELFVPDDGQRWEEAQQAMRHSGAFSIEGLCLPLRVDVLFWPTSRSYTGQQLAEIHTIGSPPLLEGILAALFERGVRPARRGEFTLRAFLAGRIDLLQAEAVLGVIDATDQQQLKTALAQLGGELSGRIAQLHEELLLQLADLEAGLDFVEEDIEFVSREELRKHLDEGTAFLKKLLEQSRKRLQTTGRRRVVLAGLPNAGKSTLFNALAGNDLALVSHKSGTTRDYLSAWLHWDGVSIELIDTAGWTESAANIAGMADTQRREQSSHADLIVWCAPRGMTENEAALSRQLEAELRSEGRPMVGITTKADCGQSRPGDAEIVVSSSTGEGIADLRLEISRQLQSSDAASAVLGSTSARCRESLVATTESLRRASDACERGQGDELIAMELREAIDHLGRIVGTVYTDDVLDRIFSRFCIGK